MNHFLTLMVDGQQHKYISLAYEDIMSPALIDIPEDAIFQISISFPFDWGDAKIEFGDIPIELALEEQNNKKILKSSKMRHLENYFGRCVLRIYFSKIEQWIVPIHFNVFAKKLNAIQAESILLHLSKKGEDILRFCFSKTQYGADQKKSEHKDPSLILQLSENIIDFLARNRGYFRNHHKSKLVSKSKISPREDNLSIDDSTISWLFQNLDQLAASDRMDFDVSIKGWKYRLSNIHHAPLTNDTDVFENQVILSLIFSIKERLTKYLNDAKVVNLTSDETLPGYVSLNSILSKIFPITGFWKNRCEETIAQANTLIMFIQKTMPCKRVFDLRPNITPFVRGNNTYRQIFNLAHDWYSLGVPNWTGQEYIVSLFSLPKLYEFFCLYTLIEELEKLNFISVNKEYRVFNDYAYAEGMQETRSSSEPFNYYLFARGNFCIELFYEAKIWSFKDFSENKRLVDLSHSSNGKWSYRLPDFLLRISSGQNALKYLVLDSKYSSPSTICEYHLPSLVNKYLLGFGEVDSRRKVISQAPIIGVFALHPNTPNSSNSTGSVISPKHLNRRFGPTNNLVIPSVASIEMGPLQNNQFANVLEKLLEYCENTKDEMRVT